MARVLVLGGIAESLITFRGVLMQEMLAAGHQVYACAPNASKDIQDALLEIGIIYQDIDIDRTGMKPLRDIKSLIHIVKLCNIIKPDVFFGYTIKPVIYGSIAARISGVPKIYSMISGLGYAFSKANFKSKIVGMIAQRLYRLALSFNQRVFFQNPDDMHLFLHLGILKSQENAVLVNGSGVDLSFFHPKSFPSSLSFLLIARLLKDKGIYEYVEAASIIKQKYPEVKFRLVGFIDNNPSAISEHDLNIWTEKGTIEFLGRLDDVRPPIADASVYVLPSYHEGTPRSVLEALALGRPVITTDAPGCRETVKDGDNGILIPVKNVQKLVEAMEYFIYHTADIERMGRKSRQIAEEKYDVKKVNAVMLGAMGLI